MPEKDSFGDRLRDKERADEDQYFAKRDRELLEKMRAKIAPPDEAAGQETTRGRCPKCGKQLDSRRFDNLVLEECPSCRGVWLSRDEIATISRRESESFLGRFFRQTAVRIH
jgi:phage FluMu protein Com